mmetsp:Transcript_18914/g.21077  ORF Transcript_18914/g.21077 Transcript_18914/m.21077 type:complete len:310 (+) Transcript_18914:310-1239(+)|eukprot:CAMPEP_0168525158 /NCGR_PEP_ID=MMETSP0405-20121227/11127_1 /TAXON_ID=498012 /ORGANISM="Trichosphaerium sp, Strain Am-I-7 wt" /LENGTH=309 /DNA_ID=CAMNT_0008547599 /DNA_START=199 /DNA_END=1128 /DNA_ORIENTATION=+
MKQTLVYILFVSAFYNALGQVTSYAIQNTITDISSDAVCPDDPGFKTVVAKTKNYILSQLKSYNYTTSVRPGPFNNIVAYSGEITTDMGILMVHYQPRCTGTPGYALNPGGIDDNAAGIGAALEIARELAGLPGVFLVFIDDSCGKLLPPGAAYFVDNFPFLDKITWGINLDEIANFNDTVGSANIPESFSQLLPAIYEMIKEDGFRGNFIAGFADLNSTSIAKDMEGIMSLYGVKMYPFSLPYPASSICTQGPLMGLCLSINGPFWLKNIPILELTDMSPQRNLQIGFMPNTTWAAMIANGVVDMFEK